LVGILRTKNTEILFGVLLLGLSTSYIPIVVINGADVNKKWLSIFVVVVEMWLFWRCWRVLSFGTNRSGGASLIN
jgi:hypothetical protein